MSGILVSFLGIDGIGKSSLAKAFVDELEISNVDVITVSWRGALGTTTMPWPGEALQQLWLETFRCLFGGGVHNNNPITLPRDFSHWQSDGWEQQLSEFEFSSNSSAGAVAASLVEIAGNVILAHEVIAPALARGAVVVQETFPFKHVLKEIVIAEQLARLGNLGSAPVISFAEDIHRLLPSVFGSSLFLPDVGVLVDGPVDLAYKWRVAQSGGVGAIEDLGAAGKKGKQSFIELQEITARAFREIATDWNWIVHSVDDSGLDNNIQRGLELLRGHPRISSLLSGESAQDQ